jgi:site-specific recombinase XerD
MYFTDAHVEELCNIKLADIQINERYGWIYLYEKDNKQRKVDLNKSIRKILAQYLNKYEDSLKGEYLFDSQRSTQVATGPRDRVSALDHKLCSFRVNLKRPLGHC